MFVLDSHAKRVPWTRHRHVMNHVSITQCGVGILMPVALVYKVFVLDSHAKRVPWTRHRHVMNHVSITQCGVCYINAGGASLFSVCAGQSC